MKNLSSWLLVMFMAMFWIFRVIVAFQAQYGNSFGGFIAFNFTFEIILLFVTILCMILVLRRNFVGGVIYLISYGYYFGGYIVTNALPSILSGETVPMGILQNAMVSGLRTNTCILRIF